MRIRLIQGLTGVIFLLLAPSAIQAQGREMWVRWTETPPRIDGRLDEAAWQGADPSGDFWQHYPSDQVPARHATQVRLLFDQRYLYIAARCFQDGTGAFVVQSLKRDFEFLENDAFEVYIDAFGDATSGLVFGVNPFGVQRDGIIPNGGVKDIDLTWDNRWLAEVSRQENGWTVEMAIPFKSLRYKKEQQVWQINFARSAIRQNEVSTWAPVTRGYATTTLASMGQLRWEKPPPPVHHNVALVPYLAVQATDEQQSDLNLQPLGGADAKIGINSSLHLDLTINPDFSQVEVDQQIIDLNRFELFFPEKRLFFLENSDLFSNLGNSRVRPFFSRRIGSVDHEPVPILFGARLSGKMGKSWKIGCMNVQTKDSGREQPDGQNYLVATIQKSILSGSSLTAFISNRQLVDGWQWQKQDFSRIGGLELDYRSKDSKWTGKTFLHYSLTPDHPGNAMAFSAKLRYRVKTFSFFAGIDGVGENYVPDLGFVPRLYHYDESRDTSYRIPYLEHRVNGYYRLFLDQNPAIDYVGTELRLKVFTDQNLGYQEHQFDWHLSLNFINKNRLTFIVSDYSQILFFPFTLDGLDKAFPAQNYQNQKYSLEYDSGKREALFGKARIGYSGEFMGKRFSVLGELNYRQSQFAVFGLNFSNQQLHDFPETYGSARFTLLGSRIELSFNRRFFLTTFLQYNTQSENFNINGRFNWRFQPMSDLYIVYTSNYFTHDFQRKDGALVLKLNYWLNL